MTIRARIRTRPRFRPSPLLSVALLLCTVLQTSCTARMFEDLSARNLKKRMDDGARMVIVDLRTVREYQEGHVPTAISLSPDKLYLLRQTLPADKTTMIVFYCRGYG